MTHTIAASTSSSAKDQRLDTAGLLFHGAKTMGLEPAWIVPGKLFAITINGCEMYINFARSPLNSHTSTSLARDKYITRLILQRHNMQNIPFARPRAQAEAETFLQQYKKIVAKPVTGLGARDIHIITTVAQLAALQIDTYILEQYIAGPELRYLVLDGKVIGVHRSDYGTSVREDRPLQRISYPEEDWDVELAHSSLTVARLLGLRFAAVDYLVDASGLAYVLEVNTNPGLEWFHTPTLGPSLDLARHFLEAIVKDSKKLPTNDNALFLADSAKGSQGRIKRGNEHETSSITS